MARPGGPGSAQFRSARSGPAGVREAADQQKREPDAELEQPSGTTPELDPVGSRRCACVLPAATPGRRKAREEAREEVTAISSKTELPKTRQFLERRHQPLRQDF